jgi:hypothetical protein
MFDVTGPHFCPICPEVFSTKSKRRIGESLEEEVRNYSGCGVDMAVCINCNRKFVISYKVDQIKEVRVENK